MTRERARLTAALLLGCAACGNYQHPRAAESGGKAATPLGAAPASEPSESEAWDAALDDARDAWSRSATSGSRVAIRFEARTPSMQGFSVEAGRDSIHARAFVDGRAVDAFSPPLLGNGSGLIGVEALDGGHHSLRAFVESAAGRVLIEKTISFDVDDSHDVLLRTIVSNKSEPSSSWKLEVVPLVARRMSMRERADQDVERIDADIRTIQLNLAVQRGSLDAKSMRCVNDELSQIFVAKRASDELHGDLIVALPGDPERAAQIASRITLQRRHVAKLARDSRDCVLPTSSLLAMMVPTGP